MLLAAGVAICLGRIQAFLHPATPPLASESSATAPRVLLAAAQGPQGRQGRGKGPRPPPSPQSPMEGQEDSATTPVEFDLGPGVRSLPAVGLGTFQVKGEDGYRAVTEALKVRRKAG